MRSTVRSRLATGPPSSEIEASAPWNIKLRNAACTPCGDTIEDAPMIKIAISFRIGNFQKPTTLTLGRNDDRMQPRLRSNCRQAYRKPRVESRLFSMTLPHPGSGSRAACKEARRNSTTRSSPTSHPAPSARWHRAHAGSCSRPRSWARAASALRSRAESRTRCA